jgi:hypothetical protein
MVLHNVFTPQEHLTHPTCMEGELVNYMLKEKFEGNFKSQFLQEYKSQGWVDHAFYFLSIFERHYNMYVFFGWNNITNNMEQLNTFIQLVKAHNLPPLQYSIQVMLGWWSMKVWTLKIRVVFDD